MGGLILGHIHDVEPGTVIFSEVMFDENISGELPEHIEFIHNTIPILESWGHEVKILHSDKTFVDCFYHIIKRSEVPERNGLRVGFPMSGLCDINSRCKVKPIRQYMNKVKGEYVQYLGIAADEPERLERMHKDKHKKSLLEIYDYTEEMAYELCKQYGLLSPVYQFSMRGGCWFCPNARDGELRHLRSHHRELWEILLRMETEPDIVGNIWNTLTKVSIHDKEQQFLKKEKESEK